MNVLVWQWGRRGGGPRFAACLADALRQRPDIDVALSLCRTAEIMTGANPPRCEVPVRTYRGMVTLLLRLITAPLVLPLLIGRLRRIGPDLAICAMPGPLDLLMAIALRVLGTQLVVVVHDADPHLGDGFPGQMLLQRLLCRRAAGLVTLSGYVATRLREQGLAGPALRPLIPFTHPPFAFNMPAVTDRQAGPRRLLCFGRLLPYKGLDLLAASIAALPAATELRVRVVGLGPETAALNALRCCRQVTVENRWVPENEIGSLLAWSDAVILPYREASQSGVAAAALAAGLPVIATRVGGLGEQLALAPQAVLCPPDASSLTHAIGMWLEAPCRTTRLTDAAAAWRLAASDLLLTIANLLPAASRPAGAALALPSWLFRLPERHPRPPVL